MQVVEKHAALHAALHPVFKADAYADSPVDGSYAIALSHTLQVAWFI